MPETQTLAAVAPFSIEAEHPNMSDLLVQSIPGCRLRSSLDPNRTTIDPKTGDEIVPRDRSIGMSGFPRTPGMQLHVNPEDCTYIISDPLHDNEELRDRISQFLKKHHGMQGKITVKGPVQGRLDIHRMKTLCRELLHTIENGHAKVVKGPMPLMDDIEDLPGHYLLNPGLRTGTTQPVYEKDWDEWVDRLSHSGG